MSWVFKAFLGHTTNTRHFKKTKAFMGKFIEHIIPGLALALLGLWHTINTIKAYYLKGAANFKSRFWYPCNCYTFKFKHIELIFILFFSIFAILMQVLDFPSLRFTSELINFEHATMFIHLAISAAFTLCVELTQSSDTLSGVVGIFAASVFGQELFILHYHSSHHAGIEGHYHWLLQLIVIFSFISALAAASFSSSFSAAFVLSVSVVFQGCWFVNMGFMLWVPELVPMGCALRIAKATGSDALHGTVTCGSNEAYLRAKALANLQFSWILSGILILTGFICLKLAGKGISKRLSPGYEQLDSPSPDFTKTIEISRQTRV